MSTLELKSHPSADLFFWGGGRFYHSSSLDAMKAAPASPSSASSSAARFRVLRGRRAPRGSSLPQIHSTRCARSQSLRNSSAENTRTARRGFIRCGRRSQLRQWRGIAYRSLGVPQVAGVPGIAVPSRPQIVPKVGAIHDMCERCSRSQSVPSATQRRNMERSHRAMREDPRSCQAAHELCLRTRSDRVLTTAVTTNVFVLHFLKEIYSFHWIYCIDAPFEVKQETPETQELFVTVMVQIFAAELSPPPRAALRKVLRLSPWNKGSVSCLRDISSGTQSITAELALTSKIPH
ncbi:unnamed protein product [Pleuronectes platessa]|uniref:Uncharacterized protein n=1 Tax=Pleuronectes platessa TaxID=8262 RepID=A0A9N7UWA4_PLEPL|nr:unnamed protein product [Pleuronectes platessa]